MGYALYFLIVSDFARYAASNGIYMSCAARRRELSSLQAWALRLSTPFITDCRLNGSSILTGSHA